MTAFLNYKPSSYLDFFGLDHAPFPMAPDDTDFYFSNNTEEIIQRVCRAILARRGFILLTGDVGLGKTTLTRRIISQLEENKVETCLVLHSFYQEHDLLKAINRDFGLTVGDQGVTSQMERLNEFLIQKYNQGVNCTIIIDDAQSLSIRSLEFVRMLSNLEADQEKLVQILLVGQTELEQTMHLHEMRQLKSRVALWEMPRALNRKGLENYVLFKLNKAGDAGRIRLEKAAMDRLYKLSRGNFRRVNVIMDNALENAFSNGSSAIKKRFVKDITAPKNPEKKSAYAGPVIFVLTLIVLGWLAGGLFFYRTALNSETKPEVTTVYPVDEQPPARTLASIADSPRFDPLPDLTRASSAPPGTAPPESESASDGNADKNHLLSRFLSFYALEQARQPLFEHLHREKDFQKTRDIIFNDTGYQLIRLSTLAHGLENQFSILSVSMGTRDEKRYYLFWKPTLIIDRFFLYLKSPGVEALQRMLQKTGHFADPINGTVKPSLVESIEQFQQEQYLDPTGYPDPETLFLLTHLTRDSNLTRLPNIPKAGDM